MDLTDGTRVITLINCFVIILHIFLANTGGFMHCVLL